MIYPSRMSVSCDGCCRVMHGEPISGKDGTGDDAEIQAQFTLNDRMKERGWRVTEYEHLCPRCARRKE